jgi:hypothetical protein
LRRHHVRAHLAEAEAMTKSISVKDKVRALATDAELRTLQQVPSERATNYDLEIPAAQSMSMLAVDRDLLSTTGRVPSGNDYVREVIADAGSCIAIKRVKQVRASNRVCPIMIRHHRAIAVVNSSKIFRRAYSPQSSNVRGFASTRCAKVGICEIPSVIDEHRPSSFVRSPRQRFANTSTIYRREPLTMRQSAKIVTFLSVSPEILQRECSCDDCLCFQCFELIFGTRFERHHAEDIVLNRHLARCVVAVNVNADRRLGRADAETR